MTNLTGINSLLNDAKLDYRRGDRITYVNARGANITGKYVMASSADDYIVLNLGGKHGRPSVVHVKDILKVNGKKI